MVHGIWGILDAHPNWAVLQVDIANTFNVPSHVRPFSKSFGQWEANCPKISLLFIIFIWPLSSFVL